MNFFQCIPLSEAKRRIDDSLLGIVADRETVLLPDALGRVAAETVKAKENLPPFSRSVVDGFAVRSADTFGASEAAPAVLEMIGEVQMGEMAAVALQSGQTLAIPTGGMLPATADAVVMLEHSEQLDEETLLVLKMVAPGENMVSPGEDIQLGSVILAQGQTIGSQHIGALAACGYQQITVRKRLTVAVISTGDELVDINQPVAFGQIRDVNSYALAALLTESGCDVRRLGIVKDSYEQFFAVLTKAVTTCQLVVISGGSSVGARDFTVKAIEALGNPGLVFHGLAIKPGKPTIFGMIGRVPVFGLPGHPVAAMTVCAQVVTLAVRKMLGQSIVQDKIGLQARLSRNVASAPGRDDFVPVRLKQQGDIFVAEPILGKSGLICILTQAEGVVHIEADKSGLFADELVSVQVVKGID